MRRPSVRPTVLSCHCLPSSLPLLPSSPALVRSRMPTVPRVKTAEQRARPDRINTIWMAAFYIPERSRSGTIDLWLNVVWTGSMEAASAPSAPLKHLCPLPGSAQCAVQGRLGSRPPARFHPSGRPYCCLGCGLRPQQLCGFVLAFGGRTLSLSGLEACVSPSPTLTFF